jgi:hypothetical protein
MSSRAIAFALLAFVVSGAASVWPAEGAAAQPERGFFDLYGGYLYLYESDVPGWKIENDSPTVGGRVGVWIGTNWGLAFRTWYFQTDAKLRDASPSDLAFLGLSLELMGRWVINHDWALYGTLGPMVAVTTLDRQRDPATRKEDDSRSVAPGGSLSIGAEIRVFKSLRAFAELQGTLVYPEFHFRGQTSSPRLLTTYGLTGLRLGF